MCVYPPPCALEQVPADVALTDRWSSSARRPMQVRVTGTSCPKVHEGDVVWCLLSALLPGLRRKEGWKEGGKQREGRNVGRRESAKL